MPAAPSNWLAPAVAVSAAVRLLNNALRLGWGAFFLVWTVCAGPVNAGYPCQLSAQQLTAVPAAAVRHVIDGDTVVLGDGEHLRLLGINTPELAHPKNRRLSADQPLARAATQALQALLTTGDGAVHYRVGAEPRDRYRRLLADLYLTDGRSVAAELLAAGLGWQVTFAPNDSLAGCLAEVEQRARDERLGVWAGGLYPALEVVDLREGGFARVVGRVSAVNVAQGGDGAVVGNGHLLVEGGLWVAISAADAGHFDAATLAALRGQRVELRGWLSQRRQGWRLQLTSPYNLTAIE